MDTIGHRPQAGGAWADGGGPGGLYPGSRRRQRDRNPELELEAASYLFLLTAETIRWPIRPFVSLYNRGFYQTELMDLMTQAFYLPNAEDQKKRYARNCAALAKYPYLLPGGLSGLRGFAGSVLSLQ